MRKLKYHMEYQKKLIMKMTPDISQTNIKDEFNDKSPEPIIKNIIKTNQRRNSKKGIEKEIHK